MFMEASSSMAARRETMAFCSASLLLPSAMVAVHTTCMAMGMDATSSTTPNASACWVRAALSTGCAFVL
jgi:hypothetical protein